MGKEEEVSRCGKEYEGEGWGYGHYAHDSWYTWMRLSTSSKTDRGNSLTPEEMGRWL